MVDILGSKLERGVEKWIASNPSAFFTLTDERVEGFAASATNAFEDYSDGKMGYIRALVGENTGMGPLRFSEQKGIYRLEDVSVMTADQIEDSAERVRFDGSRVTRTLAPFVRIRLTDDTGEMVSHYVDPTTQPVVALLQSYNPHPEGVYIGTLPTGEKGNFSMNHLVLARDRFAHKPHPC